MRILHIIKSLGRGGAEMLLPETLKLHDQKRFEFHYAFFLPWKDQMVSAIEQNGGKIVCFKASNNIQLILKAKAVARYVQNNNIQLIHAHLPWAGVVARIVGRLTGIPVIYTEHNMQERYHFATRFVNVSTMNLLSRVIGVSEDVSGSVRKHKKNLKAPLQTILNGVNTDKFQFDKNGRQEIRAKLGIPETAPVIGTVAVFRFQKRLDLWMEVAFRVVKEFPEAHFVIVGDGPLKEQLFRKRKELGLEQRLHLPGLQTEIRPWVSAFDVYLMTSSFEGLPIALLEAMSLGCPVVSTGAGGIKELIRDTIDGRLAPVDRWEETAVLLSALLMDKDLRMKLGAAARQRVVDAFSLKKMVQELEAVYDGFEGSSSAPPAY